MNAGMWWRCLKERKPNKSARFNNVCLSPTQNEKKEEQTRQSGGGGHHSTVFHRNHATNSRKREKLLKLQINSGTQTQSFYDKDEHYQPLQLAHVAVQELQIELHTLIGKLVTKRHF